MLTSARHFFREMKAAIKRLDNRWLFFFLIIMVVSHATLFWVYSTRSSDKSDNLQRAVLAQQIFGVMREVRSGTPTEKDIQSILNEYDASNVTVTLTQHPTFDIQLTGRMRHFALRRLIWKMPEPIQFSRQLPSGQWLNIAATLSSQSWTMQILLLCLELLVAVVILFSVWSINRFRLPLKQFMQAADRLGVDIHAPPLPVAGPPIVKDTAHAMNAMQNRILDLLRDRTQMLAAISHDLRTPITRLKLRAELIEALPERDKVIRDLDEMETMISEILAFSKEDSRAEQREQFDLAALLASLCDDAGDMGHEAHYQGPSTCVNYFGRPLALKRALGNLINNAITYGDAATVNITQRKHVIQIRIEDKGQGIAADKMEQVFAPFYREEASRSRQTGGMGLGLAVAKDIIQAHGGTIRLENRQDGGLRVVVVLDRVYT